MGMDATIAERMSEQHEAIDARLATTAMHLDAGRLAMAADAATALATALRHHAHVEEAYLFPAFASSPVADLEVLATMHAQHAEIAELVAALSAAAAAHDQGHALRAKAALHAALGAHDDEEELLCAALDRSLDAAARAALLSQLAR